MAGKRVLVVGDVMADHYVWGKVERISPEAPIPVVQVFREETKPGGAANVACNIAALGGRVILAGVTGADSVGTHLKGLLRDKGISVDGLLEDPSRPTVRKTRVIAHQQQVVRVDRERNEALAQTVRDALAKVCLRLLDDCDAVLLSDYGKGSLDLSLSQALIRRAKEKGKVSAADPKPANISWFAGCTVVTPNQSEASAASGLAVRDDASADAAARAILGRLDCASVLVTRGEHGMTFLQAGAVAVHIPTVAQRVFDVTGAGDTVIATLALALAAGMPATDACFLANAAAGIVVGEVGVAVVTPEGLERSLA
ncbi:MAG: D-glycero-beta-D-manno-heptose-7-phosphate kinase [bacterium]